MQQNKFVPQIIWEKWVDPFGEDLDEADWNNYDENEDDAEELSYQKELLKNNKRPVKVIASPLGLIPYNEYTSSSKIFNFWVGHANFNLSKDIIDIIEKCSGIEILDIFTRYRFRIAIGKCFTDSEVMSEINNITYHYFNNYSG
jgi:hypothetical protein